MTTIKFANTHYSNDGSSAATGGEAPTFVSLASLTSTELKRMYNELQFELGSDQEVSRFADSATAIRRTWAKLQEYAKAKPETQAAPQAIAEHTAVAPEVQTKAGDPAVMPNQPTPDLGGVSPGHVDAVGGEPMKGSVRAKDAPHPAIKSITSSDHKTIRLSAAAAEAIAEKPTPAAPVSAPAAKPGAGLPVASGNAAKDAEMPTLRRVLKPVELAPKPKVYPRKAGSKQALLVDLLSRPQGATFGELYDALAEGGKPWKGVTIRSGLAWDMNHLAGYGVSSTAQTGEEFARQGRWYEAKRLGMVFDGSTPEAIGGSATKPGPAYDPAFKLLVYRLTYPAGMTAPFPHTPRAGPSAEQKAAASAALHSALKNGGEV